jgi:hypothetical protein
MRLHHEQGVQQIDDSGRTTALSRERHSDFMRATDHRNGPVISGTPRPHRRTAS